MKPPAEVQLSREDGEALRTRLAEDALTAADRRVLDQVLQWYFWLLFALQEATFSLKRLRILVFGERAENLKPRLPGRHRTPAVGLEGQAVSQRTPWRRRRRRPKRSGHLLRASGAPAMDARAPRPTVEPSTWSAGMRPWR